MILIIVVCLADKCTIFLQKKLEKEKSRQNTITFTHLRDLYGERKVSSLIDRVTGAVNIETAAEQFPNLPRELTIVNREWFWGF